MDGFGAELDRLRRARGVSLHALARLSHYDVGYLSKVVNGRKRGSRELAVTLDGQLGADGVLVGVWDRAARPPVRGGPPSRAVEALQVAMGGDAAGLDIVCDGLRELVWHYARVIAVAPSATAYGELLSARSFAGSLAGAGRSPDARRCDLMVTSGWLSSLLGMAATDAGDHAAALVWCADAERCGRDAGFGELEGWAALTRALLAYYQGDPRRSVDAARRGQVAAPAGTVAHARLAAQEMRSLAMLGDVAGTVEARRRAATALDRLNVSGMMPGVYSLPRAEDPPYTATSLLLVKRYRDAAETTRRLIETAYSSPSGGSGGQPTSYARTLLILGLAGAGLGEVEEAAAAGVAALECGPVVWSTLVLAGKLDRALARTAAGTAHAAGYHARYVDVARHLPLPRSSMGSPGDPG